MKTVHHKSKARLVGHSPPQTALSPLWTRKQVAAALRVCPVTVSRYTRAGLLPCLKITQRMVRYNPATVLAFIRAAEGETQ